MAQDFVGLPGLDAFIQGKINQAITEEREACARLADDHVTAYAQASNNLGFGTISYIYAQKREVAVYLAEAIRARSVLTVKEGADV
jgi:hypothetical protein